MVNDLLQNYLRRTKDTAHHRSMIQRTDRAAYAQVRGLPWLLVTNRITAVSGSHNTAGEKPG